MKKHLLAMTAVFALAATYAGAADLPAKAVPAPCNCTCDATQFGGWYVGISGGAVKHIAHRSDHDGFLSGDDATFVTDKWGGIVGGTIGWNIARCRTVWGFEVDGSWTSVSKTFTTDPNSADPEQFRSRMDAFLTARLRAGVALDNMLLYVTGGLAAARFRTTWEDFNAGATPLDTVTFSEWRLGWVAGFGVEWTWTGNWTFKSEALYANFSDRERSHTFPGFGPATFTHSDEVWIARVGLNYKFGGFAPVTARN
jgi:outer membrane immunogenic protein